MEEFLKEALRVECDLVRLSYWISALEWKYYSTYAESLSEECRRLLDQAVPKLRSLRSETRIKEE